MRYKVAMRNFRGRVVAAVLFVAAAAAAAEEPAAWAALRAGEPVVALMRHADAPGTGDPPGWRLDDCRTQRNLGDAGRADARAAGLRFKREGVRFAKVLSSPWCRCLETARLLDLGAPQTEPRLSNAYVLAERREALAQGGREVLAAWKGPGPLLVVTHGENIRALTGRSSATSEVVVVAVAPDGALGVLGAFVPTAAAAPQR